MREDNNEDLLDIFAAVAMMGHWASCNGNKFRSDDAQDSDSRCYYRQAQSMLRVRKEFIDQGEPSNE